MMPDLEGEVSELYSAYVSALRGALEQLEPWWEGLVARHGRRVLKLRWPAGPASHPRVLAIYRDYHRRFADLRPPTPPGPAPRFDDDAAWGSEVETAPSSLLPPAPERLLIDRLAVEAEALHARLVYLLMPPLGEAPQPRPSMRTLGVEEPDPRGARSFAFEHRHGVERGLRRLLGAAADLAADPAPDPTPTPGPGPGAPRRAVSLSEAGEVHRLAHGSYLRDLERALVEAERWWARELSERERRATSEEEAREGLWSAHPVGPVGHPRVLGVIQAYWALCHEINEVLVEVEAHVAPELLLLGWLRESRRETWLEVLTAMPYWPVGLDAGGRWV